MEKAKVYYCDMHATGRMNLLEKLKFLMIILFLTVL